MSPDSPTLFCSDTVLNCAWKPSKLASRGVPGISARNSRYDVEIKYPRAAALKLGRRNLAGIAPRFCSLRQIVLSFQSPSIDTTHHQHHPRCLRKNAQRRTSLARHSPLSRGKSRMPISAMEAVSQRSIKMELSFRRYVVSIGHTSGILIFYTFDADALLS